MKMRSLRITFAIAALLVSLVAAVIAALVFDEATVFTFAQLILIVLISCLLVSAVLYGFISSMVFRKADKLIETVRSFRTYHDRIHVPESTSSNEISDLEDAILAWADDRKNEIERLKQLEVYRKEFLGNVSHELKTPIFNIQGYVLTLLDGGLEDPAINRDYLQRAERSIDRMITIVDDLEAISQLETGELQLEQEAFDLSKLAAEVIEAQELKATERGIILSVQSDPGLMVFGDRFRIRQVLVNLVVNSVKYGKEYGETRIKIRDTGESVTVEVADNGIGIAKHHLPRLFERFYRVDKSRSREMGGTGLGLAIVKHIIEAHGQTIQVMSTEGAGTVFTFTLRKP